MDINRILLNLFLISGFVQAVGPEQVLDVSDQGSAHELNQNASNIVHDQNGLWSRIETCECSKVGLSREQCELKKNILLLDSGELRNRLRSSVQPLANVYRCIRNKSRLYGLLSGLFSSLGVGAYIVAKNYKKFEIFYKRDKSRALGFFAGLATAITIPSFVIGIVARYVSEKVLNRSKYKLKADNDARMVAMGQIREIVTQPTANLYKSALATTKYNSQEAKQYSQNWLGHDFTDAYEKKATEFIFGACSKDNLSS